MIETGMDNQEDGKLEKSLIKSITTRLSSLARLARNTSIHLLMSTQFPSRDVLNSNIMSNADKIIGKADSVLSLMVAGSEIADREIQKDKTGRFILCNGSEFIIFQSYQIDEHKTMWGGDVYDQC